MLKKASETVFVGIDFLEKKKIIIITTMAASEWNENRDVRENLELWERKGREKNRALRGSEEKPRQWRSDE